MLFQYALTRGTRLDTLVYGRIRDGHVELCPKVASTRRCAISAKLSAEDLPYPAPRNNPTRVRPPDRNAGLSHQFRHDHERLQDGIVIYDALYRWARDGYDESHDWPVTRDAR